MTTKRTRHAHRYGRLSDVAIYCSCGDIRFASEPVCTRPHYYPNYPAWIWQTPPWYPYTITSGGTSPIAGDITIGSTLVLGA